MNVKDVCIAVLALAAGALGPAVVLVVEAQTELSLNGAAVIAGLVIFAVAILACAGLHLCREDDEDPAEQLEA